MKKQKGFSLIEILAAITIGMVILVSAYELFDLASIAWSKTNARFEVRQNARIAIERMSRDIRQSVKIINNIPETKDTPANEIKFQDGHTINKIQYITYSLDQENLIKKYSHYSFISDPLTWVFSDTKDGSGNSPSETTDSSEIVALNIKSLDFWGSDAINISLLVSKGNYQEDYETTVMSRNIL
ncbi:MAG: prepilin-type N-terminal cleavage/methylation domain-containing protein [Patescibacteria group bacterium]|jgi:prepilin-type N-terminal cleavage/methylation domain-containing protein